ncbi:MAG: hypothetical protein K6F29_00840 [Bacteroidales bacterium]|jgi:putative iron-only hydrogenase system regulator|nr:hypothetical protein [Bacteroidales bacterium]MBQ4478788.1 hypothetical protein [Bacteroidales bacterium]MCR5554062.1 hypothetical protein [Bacteroidales bacterium]
MEKKIGIISIAITQQESVGDINNLLTSYANIILSRNGLPLRDEGVFVISLVVKSDGDTINALTGKLGRLSGVKVKSILIKQQ